MESKNATTGEFEAAIKNFSKISLEVDSLINLGNADAHKIMNKSMENRTEAIELEANRRLTSFAAEQKGTKSKESIQTHGTLEQLFKAEVELEFDNGVAEQKVLLRRNSTLYESKVENNSKVREVENKKSENAGDDENKKSENADEESAEDEDSDEEEEESSEESENESRNEESSDKESSEEEEDDGGSTENEYTDDENTVDEAPVEETPVENVTDSSKK